MSADVTTGQFQQWVQQAKDNHYWLVLVYHPVDDLGVNPYGTTTQRFAEQLQAIKESGLPVMTMRDALNEIMPQLDSTWRPLPDYPAVVGPSDPPPGPVPPPDPTPPSDHVAVPTPILPPPGPLTGAPQLPTAGALPTGLPPSPVLPQPPAQTRPPRDRVPPSLKIVAPRGSYRRGSRIRARFTCQDNVRVVACKGSVPNGKLIDTRSRGLRRFRVAARDAAGNRSSRVVIYRIR